MIEEEDDEVPWDAIELLQQGSPLLKFGRLGDPHFRFFVVSENCEILSWHSPKKPKDESEVRLSECELLYGQRTDVFERNVMSEHFRSMNLSFSLVYADRKRSGRTRTLDLVCKDRHEFDAWLRGLAFLVDGPPPEDALLQWNRTRRMRARTVEHRRLRPSLQPGRAAAIRLAVEDRGASFDSTSRQDYPRALSFTPAPVDEGRESSEDEGDSDVDSPRRGRAVQASSPVAAGATRSSAKKTTALSRNLQNRMRESNDVYTCGAGGWGQLGVTETSQRPFPQLVPSLLGRAVQRVVCGDAHSLALTEGGEVWVWGDGSNGRLGTGGTASEVSPRLLVRPSAKAAPYEFTHIACGARHSLAIADGVLYTWGANDAGQLMAGHRRDRLRPAPVDALQGVAIVDADGGAFHSAAVDSNGKVWTAGWNERGLLGIGSRRVYVTEPQQVRGFRGVQEEASAAAAAVEGAAEERGEWSESSLSASLSSSSEASDGGNEQVAEDDGGKGAPRLLEQPGGDEVGVVGVACGGFHTLALLEDGRVFSWGWNDAGQLGVGHTRRTHGFPCQVVSLDPCAVDIAAGAAHSAAVLDASSEAEMSRPRVMVWGAAGHGQLGHVLLPPPPAPDRQPVVPAPMTLLVGVGVNGDVGAASARAAENQGGIPNGREAVPSAGSNDSVGVGKAAASSPVPSSTSSSSSLLRGGGGGGSLTPHSPLTGVNLVSCGSYHTAVVTMDGRLWVAGDDSHGQLGLSRGGEEGDRVGSSPLGKAPPPAIRTRTRETNSGLREEAGRFRLEDSLLLEAGHDNRPRSVAHQGLLMASVALEETAFARQSRDDNRREVSHAPPPSSASVAESEEEAGWLVSDSNSDDGAGPDGSASVALEARPPWSTIGTIPVRLRSNEMPASVTGPLRLPWSMHVDVDALSAKEAPKERAGFAKWRQAVSTTVGRGLCRVESLARKEVRGVACGGCHTCVTVATEWIDDSEASRCMRCSVNFTIRVRKHHCRSCGGIFCAKCSSHRIPLLRLGFIDPVRVCDVCFGRLQGMDYMSFTGVAGPGGI